MRKQRPTSIRSREARQAELRDSERASRPALIYFPGQGSLCSVALPLLVLGLVLVLSACSGKQPAEAGSLMTVQAVAARRATIRQEVSAEAILFPLHQATIVPKISAPVLKFYVNRGDRVRAGQLLVVLENRDLAAALVASKGMYQQAKANYETTRAATLPEQIQKSELDVKSAKATYTAAERAYSSSKKLYRQGALARKQLDQADVALAQAQTQLQTAEQHLAKLQSVGEKAQIKAAQGQLAAAEGNYESAQAQLTYSEIRSPINGVVTDRPLYPGEMASSSSPLLTVMDISQVVARAHIPESQAQLLKANDLAELFAPGEKKGIPGKVTLVSPALDPSSTTVEIWVQAPNPLRQLKPGTTVRLTIVSKTVPGALLIPKAALLMEPNQSASVMVAGADGRAHQRVVQTGIQEGDRVQILMGLKEGELVITTGAYGLPDNVRIKVEP